MLYNANNGAIKFGNTEMNYVSFGKGHKHFIILPGLSDGLTTVKGKALLLAKPYTKFFDEYTVYMFSRKNKINEGYSIYDMAHDQALAIKELGLDKVSVMGVSQGGMIALALSINYPELINKLVLTVTSSCTNEMIKTNINKWIGLAKEGNHKELMVDTALKSYSEDYLSKYKRLLPLLSSLSKPKSYDRFLINAKAILSFDVVNDLDKIKCPTLIIGGSEDKIVGVDASYLMHERINNSELYVYNSLGHALYEEAKDYNDRVLEFLER